MELQDLMDLLHFYYEEDTTPTWEFDQDYKSELREKLYSVLYNKEYEYSVKRESNDNNEYSHSDPYAPPAEGEVKPYIPPTSPEDFQAILERPMGE